MEIAGHDEGTSRSADEYVIKRRELVAVHASGPTGDETLRQPTRRYPIALQSGDYLIGGHLHVLSEEEPMASLQERPPMIPLTQAWIEYSSATSAGIDRRARSSSTATWRKPDFRPVTERELAAGYLRPIRSR